MRTLEEVNKKHDQREELRALLRELGRMREAGEITLDEMTRALDEFERAL